MPNDGEQTRSTPKPVAPPSERRSINESVSPPKPKLPPKPAKPKER